MLKPLKINGLSIFIYGVICVNILNITYYRLKMRSG
jgi:hypothetical protein